jgi:hypothetical protein
MHFKAGLPPVRYCHAISATAIPEPVLRRDNDLRRIARRDGRCFARLVAQVDRNTCQVRVAADPRYTGDHRRSYLVEVPAAELLPQSEIISIAAAGIPGELLREDEELERTAREGGRCAARVERQLHWDLYRVRIAPTTRCLYDGERSYAIHLSQAEVQAYLRVVPQQEIPAPAADAALPSTSAEHELLGGMALDPVLVTAEELKRAADTLDIPQESALKAGTSAV